jgi:VWFA-related protein
MSLRTRGVLPVILAAFLVVATGAAPRQSPQEPSAPRPPEPSAQKPQEPSGQPPQEPAEPPAQPGQPTFRTTVDLVRVDVSVVNRDDEPVTDLQASDFIVTEDDAPQTVETAQFVRLDGQRLVDNGESLEIRGPSQAAVEATKEDVRLFAIFLDDYHIDRHPSITIPLRKALEGFIEQLQPTDLVVIMDPLTTLDGLRFTRNKADLLERVRTFEGRRGELFPVRSAVEEAQMTQRNVFELRAAVSLSALEAITTHLGGLREGRKSVLFVSQGPPVGMPGSLNYPRLEAALQAANRGNVTVHVLDPRPLGSAPFGGAEALRRLSVETGGRAIVNTNNPASGLKQVMADASAYYLIGYSPARPRLDGKFHKINVRVKRSGVRVTARRGYWAPTEAESNPAPAKPADPKLTGALSELVTRTGDERLIDVWVGTEPGEDGHSAVHVTWELARRSVDASPAVVEVEPVTRTGTTLGEAQSIQTLPREGDAATVASYQLKPGPLALRVTVRSDGGSVLDRWTQSLVVPDYTAASLKLGTPRVFRTRTLAETRSFEADPHPTPSASRRFRRTDRLVIDVPYEAASGQPEIKAHLTNRDGKVLAPLTLAKGPDGVARVAMPLASLAPSTYTVRVEVTSGADRGVQVVAFTVSQ